MMKKFLFLLVLLSCFLIPTTTFAARYTDKDNNFQMILPDHWLAINQYTASGSTLFLTHPTIRNATIIMKIAAVDGTGDSRETLNDYSQEEISALLTSVKTEIAQMIPAVKFKNAQNRFFAKNKTLVLNYTDGATDYCLAEFLLKGKIYMLIFSSPTKEYKYIAPLFFNLLNSVESIDPAKNNGAPKASIPLA